MGRVNATRSRKFDRGGRRQGLDIGSVFVLGTFLSLCGIKHKGSARELLPANAESESFIAPSAYISSLGTFNFASVPQG